MTEELRVAAVADGSAAQAAGVEPGDVLLSVNGEEAEDLVDYLFLTGESELRLVFRGADGELYETEAPGLEDLGLTFCRQKVRTCRNKCPFCFVDQMPAGFRPTLYLKDDDWRSSFLHGSYVTLTNLSAEDLERIKRLRVSPLYVSVHATDDSVRRRLLGNESAPPILPMLADLAASGVRFYSQVVTVPGENDGKILDQTIRDLFSLSPAAASLSVVPVGLTDCRGRLPNVPEMDGESARAVLEITEKWQKRCLKEANTRFVFAADELYLKGKKAIPSAREYEDFSQLENGVGLVASFMDEARREMKKSARRRSCGQFTWVTGRAFAPCARVLAEELRTRHGASVVCAPIENQAFGSSVTVTGLLTGADIVAGLGDAAADSTLILPSVMFRDRGDRTLDDMTAEEIRRAAGAKDAVLTGNGEEFIQAIFGKGNLAHV